MVNLKPFKSIQQSDAADYTASLAQTHKDEISNPRALLFSHESENETKLLLRVTVDRNRDCLPNYILYGLKPFILAGSLVVC